MKYTVVTLIFAMVVLAACWLSASGLLSVSSLPVTEPVYRLPDNARNFLHDAGGAELYCTRLLMDRPITFQCIPLSPTPRPHNRKEDE